MGSINYRSLMVNWGRPASRPPLETDGRPHRVGTQPFSRELLPLVEHPIVLATGESGVCWLLAQRLYAYLDWTYALETDVVLPVAQRFIEDEFCLGAGPALAEDALKIIIDEGGHALEAMVTKREVIETTAVAPLQEFVPPSFLRRLAIVTDMADSTDRNRVPFVFAMVSETLITGQLTKLPKDEAVLPVVRDAIARHAADEARHHRVFAKVMAIAWDQWTPTERDRFAPWFVEFIDAFLSPDRHAAAWWLHHLGLERSAIEAIVEDVYAPSRIAKTLREASDPSLRAMRKAGLFENQRFVDALGMIGMM